MSLTTHLNDKQSPFRKLVEESAPALATAAGQSKAGKEFARQLGFYDLAKAPLVVPLPEEVHDKRRHSPTVGTAFDIRTRMMLDQFEPSYSASALGVRAFALMYARFMKDGERIAELLADSFREAENLTIQGAEEDKDRASIIFTWCEALYRAGLRALFSSLGERLHASKTVDDLLASIPPAMLADVSNLRAANQGQVEQWRTMIRKGVEYTENPHFTGASLVGGADGDWFIDDTFSTSRSWTRSAHHGCGKSSCSSWATSSSTSTTTTKPSASASGCHDRRRSRRGPSKRFLAMTPARYWRKREWM